VVGADQNLKRRRKARNEPQLHQRSLLDLLEVAGGGLQGHHLKRARLHILYYPTTTTLSPVLSLHLLWVITLPLLFVLPVLLPDLVQDQPLLNPYDSNNNNHLPHLSHLTRILINNPDITPFLINYNPLLDLVRRQECPHYLDLYPTIQTGLLVPAQLLTSSPTLPINTLTKHTLPQVPK
jgi:hypothetical protein